jgi:hypothetical protein
LRLSLPVSSDNGKPKADGTAEGAGINPRQLKFQKDDGEDDPDGKHHAAMEADHVTLTTSSEGKEEEEEAPNDMPIGDLPDAVILDADQKLLEVYGNCYIHDQNNGSHLDHLDGGIKDDAVWQARW